MPFQDVMKKCHFCGQFQEEGWGNFYSVLQVSPMDAGNVYTEVNRKWICNAFSHSCANQLLQIFIADELGLEVSTVYTIEQLKTLPIPQELQAILIATSEHWVDSAVRDCNEQEAVHLWLPRFALRNRQANILREIRKLHEELESVLLLQDSLPFSDAVQISNEQFNAKIKKNIYSLSSLIRSRVQ